MFDAVFSALEQNEYDVIHHNEHARFRDDMTTGNDVGSAPHAVYGDSRSCFRAVP